MTVTALNSRNLKLEGYGSMSQFPKCCRFKAYSARRRLAPAAFRINIPVTAPRVSGSNPSGIGAGWLFPPARLPVICVPFIAMISAYPDVIPAWTNGTMLPDADRWPKLDYDLRMSRYYPKGKAKKRSKNQISHFLLRRHKSRCVAVHGGDVSTYWSKVTEATAA
jgi:hypothetical protein